MDENASTLMLWGKTGEAGRYHPLLFHMLDAGCVAEQLITAPQFRHLRYRFANQLGVLDNAVPILVGILVALHDIGKAAPAFQQKVPEQWARVEASGFTTGQGLFNLTAFRHDCESYTTLRFLLPSILPGLDRDIRDALAMAVGAHHGAFIRPGEARAYPQIHHPAQGSMACWDLARQALISEILTCLPCPACSPPATELSTLCLLLNGITILADWLASDPSLFPPTTPMKTSAYFAQSRIRARAALDHVGILRSPTATHDPSFTELFPSITVPRPVQSALDPDALPEISTPVLAIIEAAMGEGKTEAALLLARRIVAQQGGGGFYFALPTQATSNQLFSRVVRFLEQLATPDTPASVMLAHGQAELHPDLVSRLQPRMADGGDEDAATVQAEQWFLPQKRRLLAPFAVGTVDQCLLGALQVRHGALRLFGLAGKVVIIDEVHAYDAYMTTILERLLTWLSALGASVVLLSATLPATMRSRLTKAYGGVDSENASQYPLITLVQPGSSPQTIAPPTQTTVKQIIIARRPDDCRLPLINELLDSLANGGCAVWICNTVRSAQQTFQSLQKAIAQHPTAESLDLMLYHARMLLKDRQRVEAAVLGQFGPNGERPSRAILVATQIVEQSLDLDFDLLVSELAPIDLLLQRLGRLHRHPRQRPEALSAPRCLLVTPASSSDHACEFGATGLVYHPFILLKTLLELRGCDIIHIPEMIRPLIERVYDGVLPDIEELRDSGITAAMMQEAYRLHLVALQQARDAAAPYLLGLPDLRGRFYLQQEIPALDDEIMDAALGAQTRMTEPSVRVVLLPVEHPAWTALHRAQRLPLEVAAILRDHSVTISHPAFVHAVVQMPFLPAIERTPALRGHFVLPMAADGYRWHSSQHIYHLTVDPVLGVIIEKEDQL